MLYNRVWGLGGGGVCVVVWCGGWGESPVAHLQLGNQILVCPCLSTAKPIATQSMI